MVKSKAFVFALIVFTFIGCKPTDESDEFWEGINLKSKYTPVAFVFASTKIPQSGDLAEKKISQALNVDIPEIQSNNFYPITCFPSISDDQYNPISEVLKFLFDINGDNTFKSYPNLVENVTNHTQDTTAWINGIAQDYDTSPDINIGLKLIGDNSNNGNTQAYVRLVYNKTVNYPHSIALYSLTKTLTATQVTSSGTENNFTHTNVLTSAATATYGNTLPSKNSGKDSRLKFELDYASYNSSRSVIAIVYKLENEKPTEIINAILIK